MLSRTCHQLSYIRAQTISYSRISNQPIVSKVQKRYCDTVRKQDIWPLARNWYRRQDSPPVGVRLGISAGRAIQKDEGRVPSPLECALAAWYTSPGFAQRAGSPLPSPKVFECHPSDAHAAGSGTQTLRIRWGRPAQRNAPAPTG